MLEREVLDWAVSVVFSPQLLSPRAQSDLDICLFFCKNSRKKIPLLISLQFRNGHLQVNVSVADPHSRLTISVDNRPVEGQGCPSKRAPVCVWVSFSTLPSQCGSAITSKSLKLRE